MQEIVCLIWVPPGSVEPADLVLRDEVVVSMTL
jgi:hypothetical protein